MNNKPVSILYVDQKPVLEDWFQIPKVQAGVEGANVVIDRATTSTRAWTPEPCAEINPWAAE